VCDVEYEGVGLTQFEFAPNAHIYIGIALGLSIPDVPSPKLTMPSMLDVNTTVRGAAPVVGVAVKVADVGAGVGVGIGGQPPEFGVAPPGHEMPVSELVTVVVTVPSIRSLGVLQIAVAPPVPIGQEYRGLNVAV
jgi:hypothetical protein